MTEHPVGVEVLGHVAVVELKRPPHNFIDAEVLAALVYALEELASSGCRAAVIASDGKSFCAGANFGSGGMIEPSATGTDAFRTNVRVFYGHAIRLFETSLPLVAAVDGAAVGAGAGLAIACDMRVVSANSFFATNFVRLGIHPGFALSHTLPALIGPAKAADMLLTGRRIHGEEAVAIGLADRMATQGDVRNTALALAQEIASAAPLAVTATRATLRDGVAERVREVLDHELAEQARLAETKDSAEGIAAMLGKRDPEFAGE